LFNEWEAIREWGRIGQGGQIRRDTYATEYLATAARDRRAKLKQRRGYKRNEPRLPLIQQPWG